MKNALNILSIDFDFFQIVDKNTLLTCYPDGHDFSTDLSKIIWSQYYANPQTCDKINAVTANHKLIGDLKTKLKKSKAEAYAALIPFLKDNIVEDFIDKFKVLFLVVVEPQEPLWYVSDEEEG